MSAEKSSHLTIKQKRLLTIASLAVFLLVSGVLCWFVGKPLLEFRRQPELFREFIDSYGAWGRIVFLGLTVLQVVFAIIPGEPLEIGTGYAFGAVEGTLLCVAGITIGSLIVFLLVRTIGIKMVEVFFPIEKIRSLRFLKNTKRFNEITFIIFLIPGTPKDLLSYFVGLTDMKLSVWLLIASLARLPSIVTSTICGNALGRQSYLSAIIIFAATAAVSLLGIAVYNKICKHYQAKNADRADD